MKIDQIMTVPFADDTRIFSHPFLHLRKGVPQIGVIQLLKLVVG